MTHWLILLNRLANTCSGYLLAPIGFLPGWLSATLVAAATGALALLLFKYTSNQQAIKRTRDNIKANLLAVSLFHDNLAVSLKCQLRVLAGALRLLVLAVIPLLVMTPPMCLLLAQLALWYQARPLHVGEEAVLTVQLSPGSSELPKVHLAPSSIASIEIGPVRVPSKQLVCWKLRALQPGCHRLTIDVAGQQAGKELSVGDGFMPVSLCRPSSDWLGVLLHPKEPPFADSSAVQAIQLDYPTRKGWVSGSRSWLVYWFIVSMVAAFCIRPWLKVNI